MDFFSRTKELVSKNTPHTLRGFIESLGMNYETYYSGRRLGNLPRADDAVRIASALGTTVEYLVTGISPESVDYQRLRERILHALEE